MALVEMRIINNKDGQVIDYMLNPHPIPRSGDRITKKGVYEKREVLEVLTEYGTDDMESTKVDCFVN